MIDRIDAQTATLAEVQHADELVGSAVLAEGAAFVAAGVVFLVWQWRTAKNAEVLGRTGARYGPGWSIGGWFIPIGNLWIPVSVMQDLWRSSDPGSSAENWRSAPSSALVGWWWALFIVGGLAGRAGWFTDASSLSDLRSAEDAATLAAVIVAAAAVLSILVVRRVTARQVALRAVLDDTRFRAGWYPDPSQRFRFRYWDGRAWTDHVSAQ